MNNKEYNFAVNPNKLQRAIATARGLEGGITEENVKKSYLKIGGKVQVGYEAKINDLEANIKAKEPKKEVIEVRLTAETPEEMKEHLGFVSEKLVDKTEVAKKRGRPFKNA